jgi:hypothetical protein
MSKRKPKAKLVTRYVEVTIPVYVTLDEANFDEKFMGEFRKSFYPFHTIDAHAEHLAQMYARDVHGGSFIEGYGEQEGMGIELEIAHDSIDMEITDTYGAE